MWQCSGSAVLEASRTHPHSIWRSCTQNNPRGHVMPEIKLKSLKIKAYAQSLNWSQVALLIETESLSLEPKLLNLGEFSMWWISWERTEAEGAGLGETGNSSTSRLTTSWTYLLLSTPQSPGENHCRWWLHKCIFPCPPHRLSESPGWKPPACHSPAGNGRHWRWVVHVYATSPGGLGNPWP